MHIPCTCTYHAHAHLEDAWRVLLAHPATLDEASVGTDQIDVTHVAVQVGLGLGVSVVRVDAILGDDDRLRGVVGIVGIVSVVGVVGVVSVVGVVGVVGEVGVEV